MLTMPWCYKYQELFSINLQQHSPLHISRYHHRRFNLHCTSTFTSSLPESEQLVKMRFSILAVSVIAGLATAQNP